MLYILTNGDTQYLLFVNQYFVELSWHVWLSKLCDVVDMTYIS